MIAENAFAILMQSKQTVPKTATTTTTTTTTKGGNPAWASALLDIIRKPNQYKSIIVQEDEQSLVIEGNHTIYLNLHNY